MTLRTKLFTLVSGAVVIAVVLVTLTVTSNARSSFAAVEAQRTAALVAQFRRDFADAGDEVVRRVERVAESESMLRVRAEIAKADGDYAPYVNEAAPLAAAQELDFLDIVAADGTIVSSAHWAARFGHRSPWAIDRRAAGDRADEFLQPIELPDGTALGLMAVRAVDAGTHSLYLAGGRRLDRKFLESLVVPPGMHVLLYRSLEPEVSRQQLIAASEEVIDEAALQPLIARVRQSGRETTETISRANGEEIVHGIPLPGRDGSVQGVLLVVSPGRELAALVTRIRWTGVIVGSFGIAIGFVFSYLLASTVTKPVEQLADAARTVAGGDWDVRLDGVHPSGEVGILADAFDTMTRHLRDQRERLVQAERVAAWRELARRLAHELKNPLFPLRITVDNLRRAQALPPPEFAEVFDESVQTLTTGLGNLNTVIGRFSDFAKMPAPDFAQVAPNDIVRDIVRLFRAQIEMDSARPIEVSLELDENAGTIRADAEQLGRALQNLLLNAIDAMPGGGQLTIRTRREPGVLRVDVADTGQGLDAEERERLFTPYYTTKQHGTGLGLAVVQATIADHGGKITVDSTPGRGTTFHIELPA